MEREEGEGKDRAHCRGRGETDMVGGKGETRREEKGMDI